MYKPLKNGTLLQIKKDSKCQWISSIDGNTYDADPSSYFIVVSYDKNVSYKLYDVIEMKYSEYWYEKLFKETFEVVL